MQKLVNAFAAKPSHDTAKRLVAYADRHAMTECMLDVESTKLLRLARDTVGW